MLEYSDISVYNIRLYFVWFTSKKYLILNLEALHHLHFITFISEYWDEPNNQDSIVMIIFDGFPDYENQEFFEVYESYIFIPHTRLVFVSMQNIIYFSL